MNWFYAARQAADVRRLHPLARTWVRFHSGEIEASTEAQASRRVAVPVAYAARTQRLRRALARTKEQLLVAADEVSDDFERNLAMKSTKECVAEYREMLRSAQSESDRGALEENLSGEMRDLHQAAEKAFTRRFDIGWRGVF